MSDESRYAEGDVLAIRGHEYVVDGVDYIPGGGVLQYRLEALNDAPPAHLRVGDDATGEYTICEYHEANSADIGVETE